MKPKDDRTDSKFSNQQHTGSRPLYFNEGCVYEVETLTLARDGGILDWDDRVVDVLDDRELVSLRDYLFLILTSHIPKFVSEE